MQWISVGERLPKDGQLVLTWTKDGYFESAEYWAVTDKWILWGWNQHLTLLGVTHWAEVKGPEVGDRHG